MDTVVARGTIYKTAGGRRMETERVPEPERTDYIVGLDLGKSLDYTALCVIEAHSGDNPKEGTHHCRHLQRFKLGTSYPTIVREVRELCLREPLRSNQPWLAIDQTGVGVAVVDLFRQTEINAEIRPVVIHGGDIATNEHGAWRVPKRELVSAVQVGLQTRRLKIAPELPEVGILTQELQNFQVKISSETAHDSYEARVGAHDDYVLSVAIAIWIAKNARRWLMIY